MSLLKLAAEQAEKEKSKKRKWAENGALIGAGIGAAKGVSTGIKSHPGMVESAKALSDSPGKLPSKGALGLMGAAMAAPAMAVQGGLMGLAGGAVQDHKNKKKKKAEQE